MKKIVPITVAYGDGIGPEIMNAVLNVLREAEAGIRLEMIDIGEKLYKKNYTSGISPEAWESISRTNILLKAPITTPQGGGYKSLNVTLRKALSLYANVRPSISYYPYVDNLHNNLNVVVIRENEEDLYAGVEYRHTRNMRESVKLISRTGCEKIVRYAFDYALANNRKKVTCFSKDNIMKFSDGLFHQVFDEIAKEYQGIENEHYIVDIGTARLANKPEEFDVIVTSNLFGDIISDITAELSGSVGMAGSANIGKEYAMFEAIHGSAPDIAGQDIANPSGLLNGAIMMLVHIGQGDIASMIENAWKKTLEDGIHTADIYTKNSQRKVGTKEFAQEVIRRFGQKPARLPIANYHVMDMRIEPGHKDTQDSIDMSEEKELVGVDVFVDIHTNSAKTIADKLQDIDENLSLKTISSKGLMLWPNNDQFLMESDHWCCRFKPKSNKMKHKFITNLLDKLIEEGIDFIKVENLYEFDKKRGYSLSQGE
ncbi:MAG TPA: NADP-dependent isocitrate dehydrogenase [Candidatus Megaira endosymbiont of Nemacystus decipiens]|nr:NADP-dependent isocitrate dehydrogenase [Candidatus Megaera endosymbiont of Nemacystus decipiens]